MSRERLELERVCEDPAKLLGTTACLLCPDNFIAVATVEVLGKVQAYGLCRSHWGRFVDNDRELVGEIEDALLARRPQ